MEGYTITSLPSIKPASNVSFMAESSTQTGHTSFKDLADAVLTEYEGAIINGRVQSVQSAMQDVRNDANSAIRSVNNLNSDVSALSTDVDDLSSDISTLSSDVSTLASNVTTLNSSVSTLNSNVSTLNTAVSALGSSTTAVATAAEMTDTSIIYVYLGSETGYTNGNWYYYNGSAWVSGGAFNASGADSAFNDSSTNAIQNSVVSQAVNDLRTTYFSLGYSSSDRINLISSDNVDLNTLVTPGNYSCPTNARAEKLPNSPVAKAFRLVVMSTTQTNPARVRQILITNDTGNAGIYSRYASFDNQGNATWGAWFQLASITDVISMLDPIRNEQLPEMVLHTDLEKISGGHWNSTGKLVYATSRYHSNLLPIIPGARHYLGYLDTSEDHNYVGAFFDQYGNWLSTLNTSDVVAYPARAGNSDASLTDDNSYLAPNGNLVIDGGAAASYVSLYYFVAPSNAYYFSYNLNTDTNNTYSYREYVSSKPVFALSGSGNYICRGGDALYQSKKKKKLCIIGPSSVMIDRYRPTKSNVPINDTEYVIGAQEYLAPWYQKVDSYGFSSGSWAEYDPENQRSIYTGIVTNHADLSDYDEFLLYPSGNNVNVGASEIGTYESTDVSTYFGALNATIDYIYNQVPLAKIYLMDLSYRGSYYKYAGIKAKWDTINEQLALLSKKESLELIQMSNNLGCNEHTYHSTVEVEDGVYVVDNDRGYTYDGLHSNNTGNKVTGLYLRKCMLGF